MTPNSTQPFLFPPPTPPLQWRSPHARALPDAAARTLIMGILNLTPDSFSDGGQLPTPRAAAARARALLAAGADILDIGGESTRPGHAPVSETEELARVLPAIETIRREFPAAPISIDTGKPAVARAAIHAGADIVNDTQGGQTEGMPAAIAQLRCPVILMHNRREAGASGLKTRASGGRGTSDAGGAVRADAHAAAATPIVAPAPGRADFWPGVLADLRNSIALMRAAGVAPAQIWTDPGFGFAKTHAQNLEVLKNLSRIAALGHPVLLGVSRKSAIGEVLREPVPEKRLDGTAAALVWGIQQGARMVRVHDVAAMRPFVQMADAIRNAAPAPADAGALTP